MKNYTYQNELIGKKQLRKLLAWSFTNYDSIQACSLADKLKNLGFKYASQAGISISIEDLKIPFVKNIMLEKANQEILNTEKIYLKGKITDVERFQKIIDTWNRTSESLKDKIIYYFKNYDPLNSVYIMAFSGARGNLSQVRQLVGMRGLMSDPSGEIMNLSIKKNFQEGLTITDYLMSGYGARKGIVDTALKTANSGYLTRRLIDVAQDILIREKDCLTNHSFLVSLSNTNLSNSIYKKILGQVLNKPIFDLKTNNVIVKTNKQITPKLIEIFKEKKIKKFYIRSPLTCNLYRAICQKCYGWDLSNENLIDIGEAVGILAGQSIGEPGTQLTMRTFHTGGVFTSKIRQQIISPLNGILKFYKILNTVILRTNRGEDVLVTKNSGSLILIPDSKNQNLVQIEILRNTILFPKNNQYILKDTVIGELINNNKQIKTAIKPILSNSCGEIFIPQLKKKTNLLNKNKLIWLLSGQLYNSPRNSFINFYPDYKIIRNGYIFRTKLLNHDNGWIDFINNDKSLSKRILKIINDKYLINGSKLQKLKKRFCNANYLLNFQDKKYFIEATIKNDKVHLTVKKNKQFGILITNSFLTLTGGILYYDYRNFYEYNIKNKNVFYYLPNSTDPYLDIDLLQDYKSITWYRTIIWLGKEIYQVNCEQNILLVEPGDFISEGFELIPGLFSKTSGIVIIEQKNNIIKTIFVKSGLVYEGKKFKNMDKKLYYPGEIIFPNVILQRLSFCENILEKNSNRLLIRPIEIYEFPYSFLFKINNNLIYKLKSKTIYLYKPNQFIKTFKNVNLISNLLCFDNNKLPNNHINIELINNQKINSVIFRFIEKFCLNDFISPYLRYKSIQSCFIFQKNQFFNKYSILGYLEALTSNSLEIVKFKTKKQDIKKILLISNNDCFVLEKTKILNKQINDFIIHSKNINEIGKIIIENNDFFTIQKGRPYIFPNCKNNNLIDKIDFQYKVVSSNLMQPNLKTNRFISLNYFNLLKLSIKRKQSRYNLLINKISNKFEFTKLFLKKNGKFYSCLIPQFFNEFNLFIQKYNKSFQPIHSKHQIYKEINRTLLIQTSELIKNKYKNSFEPKYQLTLVKCIEHPCVRAARSVGLHSITEDYFEQDVNSVFCKNSEFIENGETIGLLNLEKEITGDIVQGLPRIEEILEARKKNKVSKRIPTNQKKGLIIQKVNLDNNFAFKKLAISIKENEKINPHKLLKVYFNYYGSIKYFLCDRTKIINLNRLINNYESSYKSFKKVQSFILNSVQSIYQSQGVTINNKHLEIIIKQMTTKVLITYEGNTSLLRREVIDLYHIQCINKILNNQKKKLACYVPLLLGVTKAALNNPSFISAASFQETTRVLTKSAIEGRIDWLRGLKENIIIGNLIPSGTGSRNYRNCFKSLTFKDQIIYSNNNLISNLSKKT